MLVLIYVFMWDLMAAVKSNYNGGVACRIDDPPRLTAAPRFGNHIEGAGEFGQKRLSVRQA